MSLREQVISGVAWSTFARVMQQGAQILFSVLLARLLFPRDFGLVGMILVFSGFAESFSEFGFRSALVEKRDLEDRHLHSVFWLTIILGSVLAAVFVLLSPLVAAFYDEPLLKPLCRLLAVQYVFASFGIVPRALLQRRMAFRQLAKLEIVVTLLSGVTAVLLALSGWGVWSLVAQSLVAGGAKGIMLLFVSGWRPRFIFRFSAVAELFHYSIHLTGFGFVNYWARNGDDLLVGKLLGAASLGIYSRAYALMLLPISQIVNVVTDVMFTALAAIKDDKPRVKHIYLRSISIIALLSFPIMTGMYVVAEPFILSLYGSQWVAVVPILQILCVVGLLQSLNSPTGWIYTSQGRTDWMFWWGVFGSGTLVLGIVVGALFGTAKSIAIGYTAANFLIVYPCNKIPGKLIGMKFKEVVEVVAAQFCCSIVMALCVWVLDQALPSNWSSWARLSVEVAWGMVVYGSLISFFNIAAYRDVRQLVKERWLSGKTARTAVDTPHAAQTISTMTLGGHD
jgi:O-antigen/teichoic acid export membrane protein